jgi:hypothetical protein
MNCWFLYPKDRVLQCGFHWTASERSAWYNCPTFCGMSAHCCQSRSATLQSPCGDSSPSAAFLHKEGSELETKYGTKKNLLSDYHQAKKSLLNRNDDCSNSRFAVCTKRILPQRIIPNSQILLCDKNVCYISVVITMLWYICEWIRPSSHTIFW